METIKITIDKDLKNKAENVYSKLGMNLSEAVVMFLKASVREKDLPYTVDLYVPNKETEEAIEEGRRLARDPKVKKYDNMKDLIEALES